MVLFLFLDFGLKFSRKFMKFDLNLDYFLVRAWEIETHFTVHEVLENRNLGYCAIFQFTSIYLEENV